MSGHLSREDEIHFGRVFVRCGPAIRQRAHLQTRDSVGP